MGNILATGISFAPHLVAFDETAKQRLEGIDLTPLLMYVIDTTHVDALPYLAEQFDVLGLEGWALAVTEADKRALIKRAIELHRYKGTPWAIRKAVRSVGFGECEIIEGVGLDYNGQYQYSGAVEYEGGNWATFRVIIEIPNTRPVTTDEFGRLRSIVLAYRNIRSHLVDISLRIHLTTEHDLPEDQLDFLAGDAQTDTLTTGANYDGANGYAGAQNYDQSNDPGTITIEIGGFATTENF